MNWHELFEYKEGNLYWIECKKRGASGNVIAGTLNNGYVRVNIAGLGRFYCHRIIWEMHHGAITDGMMIDHINHDRSDNSLHNLRIVSSKGNQRNKPMVKTNNSGAMGVTWHKANKKWRGQYSFTGDDGFRKSVFVYYGDSFEDAKEAVRIARMNFGFHENHGRKE